MVPLYRAAAGMGACRRGYGRWDFYANAGVSRASAVERPLSRTFLSLDGHSALLECCCTAETSLPLSLVCRTVELVLTLTATLDHLDVPCFQNVACSCDSLTDDHFALPISTLAHLFRPPCSVARS